MELDPAELAYLVQRLEQSVAGKRGQMQRRTLVTSGLCVAGAGLGAAFHQWASAGMVLAVGVIAMWIGTQAVARSSPERMRPVLDAVRDAPERITRVRHHRPRYAPIAHWLEVATADHLLVVSGDDWQRLYTALQRRCPGASFVDD